MAKKKKGYQPGSGKTGRKNLKRVAGGWQNQYGVVFTDDQRKALTKSVKKSNKVRQNQLDIEKDQPHIVAGQKIGSKGQLQLMGKENEFIVSHQHHDLQKFRNKREFNSYLRKQEAIQSGRYIDDKARAYKRNFIKSLQDTYGDEAKDIINKVKRMNPRKYLETVANDEVMEIRYVPSDEKISGRLNELRTALGMKEKDEWPDEEYD